MNILLMVDVSNMYYCIKKVHQGRKLSYARLLDYVKGIGPVSKATAYGAALGNEAESFIQAIQKAGFEARFKAPKEYTTKTGVKRKADWDVGIAIDMVRAALDGEIDTIFLASADGDMSEAVSFCREKGLRVFIIGSNISADLKEVADDAIEVSLSMLEKPRPRRRKEVSNEPSSE